MTTIKKLFLCLFLTAPFAFSQGFTTTPCINLQVPNTGSTSWAAQVNFNWTTLDNILGRGNTPGYVLTATGPCATPTWSPTISQTIPNLTVLGNNSGSTGIPTGLSVSALNNLLGTAPATPSTFGVIKPDGSTIVCTAGVCSAPGGIPPIANNTVLGNVSGSTAAPAALSVPALNTLLGTVPATPSTFGVFKPDGSTIICSSGVCSASVSGGGNTTSTSLTNGNLPVNTGAHQISDSGIAAGTNSLTFTEGAASPTPTTGKSSVVSNSTTHTLQKVEGTGAAINIPGLANAAASGNVPAIASNGHDLSDSGIVAATLQTSTAHVINGVAFTKNYAGASLDVRVNAAVADVVAGNVPSHVISSFGEPATLTGTAGIVNQINIGDPTHTKMTWVVPTCCTWSVNMTGGTAHAIFEYSQSYIIAPYAVRGAALGMTIENISVSGGVLDLFNTEGIPGGGGGYYGLFGLGFSDRPGIGGPIAGGSVVTIQGEDEGDYGNFQVAEYYSGKHSLRVGNAGPCCATKIHDSTLYGNDGSGSVLFISNSASNGGPESIVFENMSIGHPGSAGYNIECVDTAASSIINVTFINTYMENSINNTTKPLVNIDGCGQVAFYSPAVSNINSALTPSQPTFHVTNRTKTNLIIQSLQQNHGWTLGTPTVQNDNDSITVPTNSAGLLQTYESNDSYFAGFNALNNFNLGSGVPIASANAITPNSPVQILTGSTSIQTINAPVGCNLSGSLACVQYLISPGGLSLIPGGNIDISAPQSFTGLSQLLLNQNTNNWEVLTASASVSGATLAANTFTGTQTVALTPAASTADVLVNQVCFAGTGTTSFPCFFHQPLTSTAYTGWATGGTVFGANEPSGNTADFFQFVNNGTKEGQLTSTGVLYASAMRSLNYAGANNSQYAWSSTGSVNGSTDTSFSRVSAGIVQVGSGTGSNAAGTLNAAAFTCPTFTITSSATPVIALANGCTQKIVMSNATVTPTVTGITTGVKFYIDVCQDATGGRVWTWPGSFVGAPIIDTAANACTPAIFSSFDGSTLVALGGGTGGGGGGSNLNSAGQGVGFFNSGGNVTAYASDVLGRTVASGTTDSITTTDCGRPVGYNVAVTMNITVPATATLTGNQTNGCPLTFINYGAGILSLTVTGGATIGGKTTYTLQAGSVSKPATLKVATNTGNSNYDVETSSQSTFVTIEQFGGIADGNTDNSSAITAAFAYATAHVGTKIYFSCQGVSTTCIYRTTTPVVIPDKTTIEGPNPNAQIYYKPASAPGSIPQGAFQITAGGYVTVKSIYLRTDSNFPPHSILFLARTTGNAGSNDFENINIQGYADTALVYGVSSEVNTWHRVRMEYDGGGAGYGFYTSGADDLGICNPACGQSSNLSLFMSDFIILADAGDTNGFTAVGDAIGGGTGEHYFHSGYIGSNINVNSIGIEIISGNVTQGGPNKNVHIEDTYMENGGIGIKFTKNSQNTLTHINVTGYTISSNVSTAQYLMLSDAGLTIDRSDFHDNIGFVNGITANVSLATLTNSIDRETRGGTFTVTSGTNNFLVGSGNTTFSGFAGNSNTIILNGVQILALKTFVVSGLPACNSGEKGVMVYVSDAAAPAYNATLTGGGAIAVPAFCNGTNWTAH